MTICKREFQFGISATGLQGDYFKISTYVILVSSKLDLVSHLLSELRNKKTPNITVLIETQLTFSS